MPLFKKHTKTDTGVNNNLTTGNGEVGSGQGPLHHGGPLNTTGTTGGYNQGHQPGTGPTGGYNQGSQPGTGIGYGGTGNPLEPRIYEGQGTTGPYPSAVGTGVGHNHGQQPNYGQQPTIPPSGNFNDHNQTRGGTGQRLTGKVEAALGTALGSETLKARGYQKEQEANAIKLQGQELAEAERLEREAMARRERAVGHGAHPANKNLGAGLHEYS